MKRSETKWSPTEIEKLQELKQLGNYENYKDDLLSQVIKHLVIQSDRLHKRHLFLSDGWGPGGRPLSIGKVRPAGNRSQRPNKVNIAEQRKTSTKNDAKSQKYNTIKWSIPGLFGQF